ERGIGVRHGLSGVLSGLDAQAAFGRRGAGAFEHGRGNVGERDLPTLAREVAAGMAGASSDIESAFAVSCRDAGDDLRDIAGVGEDVRLAVACALAVEL